MQVIKSHRAGLRKEKRARKNIYVAQKRQPKTLRSQQTISQSFSSSKPIKQTARKQTARTLGRDRGVLGEVVNDSLSVTLGTNTMASATSATMGVGGSDDDYKENDQVSHIMMCPDCKEFPPNLAEEFSSGDMVCATCGLVVSWHLGFAAY